MFALYFVGFALLAILSGSFSYSLSTIEIFMISGISFAIYYFLFAKRRVFLWFMVITVLLLSGVSFYLYKIELLKPTYESILTFLKPYYYSVKVADYYIGRLHQVILMFALGIILYRVIVYLHQTTKLKFVVPILGGLVIIPAYFLDAFSSPKDKYALYLYILSIFIYYFENYYIKLSENEGYRRRRSFMTLAITMSVLIILLASLINVNYSNPFQKKIQVGKIPTGTGTVEFEDFEIEKLEVVYNVSDEYEVASSFEHQGIELFKVKTEKLKYYKSQTFNEYNNGVWINTKSEKISGANWPVEPILRSEAILNDELFFIEDVEIIYRNLFTDSIVVGPFTTDLRVTDETTNIDVYQDGMFKSEEMVGENFRYFLSIAIPKYRTTALINYLNTQEQDEINLEDYLNLSQEYVQLATLAESITSGLNSDIEKAIAIERYLKEEYTYNEMPEYDLNQDMVNEFLFETRDGFCQQFATTMALMLRSQGIPSRFVTGFVISASQFEVSELPEEMMYRDVGESDPFKHVYDYNAHAWVEIYSPGFGWIQFEPTPGQNAVQFSDPIDLNYTPQEGVKPSMVSQIVQEEYFIYSIIGLILFGVFLVIYFFIRRGKRLKQNLRRRLMVDYRLFLMYLKAIKLEKEKDETLREHAIRIDKRLVQVDQAYIEFIEFFEEAFYNDALPEIESIEAFEAFLKDIKNIVKRAVVPIHYRHLRFVEILLLHK